MGRREVERPSPWRAVRVARRRTRAWSQGGLHWNNLTSTIFQRNCRTIRQIFEAQHRLKEKKWEYKLQVKKRQEGSWEALSNFALSYRRLSLKSTTRRLGICWPWKKTLSTRWESWLNWAKDGSYSCSTLRWKWPTQRGLMSWWQTWEQKRYVQ